MSAGLDPQHLSANERVDEVAGYLAAALQRLGHRLGQPEITAISVI